MRKIAGDEWRDIAAFSLVALSSVISFAVLYEASKLIIKDMSR